MSQALIDAMKAAEKAFLENKRTDLDYGVRSGAPPIASWPAEPCKIVFLDFDGVLNSEESARKSGTRYRFSRGSVEALNGILKQTGARLVITSSWRESWTLRENAAFMEKEGVMPGRVVGKTSAFGGERGLEIDAWLRSVPYDVESFVILDDREDMAMHRSRLVQVNPEIGLTLPLATRAIELLAKPCHRKV